MQKLLIILILISVSLFAQTNKENEGQFGITFSGFVKTDIMKDSRQIVAARVGHFLFYPAAENLDQNGEDINDIGNFNMLAIQTRLKTVITSPDVLGAKTTGVIEGAFFGHTNGDINGLRLRHAFLKLAWENSSLLVGQYWHPMFIVEVFPGTISFNTGVPFQPFSRNPQVRYTYGISDVSISITASTQRDFNSTGPDGGSCAYLRQSSIPMLDLSIKYLADNVVFGAGANYKTLLPLLLDTRMVGDIEEKYKAETKISSLSAMGFAKLTIDNLVIKAEGIYGENVTDLLMLGGYAVSKLDNKGFASEYTNIKTISGWTDLVWGKELQFGLFAAYTENLGADDNIVGPYYSRGFNIANVMRVSPRVLYSVGQTRYGAEVEYTTAAYGTPDTKGVVKNTKTAANLRFLFGVYLFF